MLEEFSVWTKIDGDEAIKIALMPNLEIDMVHLSREDGVKDAVLLTAREAHNIGVGLIDASRMSRNRRDAIDEPEWSHLKTK